MTDFPAFTRDKANFPMLWIEPLGAYMHWLPITKVQFETYICASPDVRFDERWYMTLDDLNKRISPSKVSERNYWQAFMTGITPSEAQLFAEWCGDQYYIPTSSEWFTAYKYLKTMSPIDIATYAEQMPGLADRARTLMKKMDASSKRFATSISMTRNVAHQTFMQYGALEWVEQNTDRQGNQRHPWRGAGEPNKDFYGLMISADQSQLNTPINIDNRLKYYGFRLLRRIE